MDEIKTAATEAEQLSLPSAFALKKLSECLEKSTGLGISREHIQASYDVRDNLKEKINDVRNLENRRLK